MLSRSMEIAFDSLQIRQVCEDSSLAVKTLGPEVADTLWDRLADLDAATSVADLPYGSPCVLEEAKEAMEVDLCNGASMIFGANHKTKPTGDNGRILWDRVTRVKILHIQ